MYYYIKMHSSKIKTFSIYITLTISNIMQINSTLNNWTAYIYPTAYNALTIHYFDDFKRG